MRLVGESLGWYCQPWYSRNHFFHAGCWAFCPGLFLRGPGNAFYFLFLDARTVTFISLTKCFGHLQLPSLRNERANGYTRILSHPLGAFPYSSLLCRPLGSNDNSSLLVVVITCQAYQIPQPCHQADSTLPLFTAEVLGLRWNSGMKSLHCPNLPPG